MLLIFALIPVPTPRANSHGQQRLAKKDFYYSLDFKSLQQGDKKNCDLSSKNL